MKDFFFEVSRYQWNKPGNPAIYANTPLQVDKLFAELKKHDNFSERDILSFISYAFYKVLPQFPRLCSYYFLSGKKQRKDLRMSYMVMADHKDTSLFIHPITFQDKLNIAMLRQKLYVEVEKGRKDPLSDVRFSSRLLRWTPRFLRPLFFKFFYFLSNQSFLKLFHRTCPHDLFGSVIFSYVAGLGLPSAFIPLLKHGTNSMIVAIGQVEKKLEFDQNKQVIENNYLQLSWSIDHRFTHGEELAKFYKAIKHYFENPELFFNNN